MLLQYGANMSSLYFLGYANGDSLPIFTLELQTFLQMIPNFLSFVILVIVFVKYLYKPVKKILQARADRIENDLLTAAQSRSSAESLKAEYEQKLLAIDTERVMIMEDARKEASDRLNQILGEAKQDAQDLRDRARRDIVSEQERVKAQIHSAIVDISTDMASKLVAATIDARDHERLFADAMDELEATAFRTL